MIVAAVSAVKPVPVRVSVVAVLIAPALGEIEVSVGTGGFVMVTVIALERAGVAVGVLTVKVAVPAVARSVAGTVAESPLP